jgi:hypothetical protein
MHMFHAHMQSFDHESDGRWADGHLAGALPRWPFGAAGDGRFLFISMQVRFLCHFVAAATA